MIGSRRTGDRRALVGGAAAGHATWPAVVALCCSACSLDRGSETEPPAFDTDVAPILAARCGRCHSGDSPAAGFRVDGYLDAIGCVGSPPSSVVSPASDRAPIVRALGTATHRGVVTGGERDEIERWVRGGAPAFHGTVHSPDIVNPRSDGWHGRVLARAQWKPMLDPNDPEACGLCHDGAPARPKGVRYAAPGAPSCTSCHTEPEGVLACPTCHGDGSRSYPPRNPCFFPGDAPHAGAHAAHVEASGAGLPCGTCHPVPGNPVVSGLHADGAVEIVFDARTVGSERSYDRTSGVCAVSCHDLGGARSRPSWNEPTPMGCGDCHGSPPRGHFVGPCTKCHHDANADGTRIIDPSLHMNGRIDLGDGSGTCGACHGANGDPWPSSGAHRAHRSPTLTRPVDCGDCHVVPKTLHAPGHLDGIVEVVFGGRALDRDSHPVWDGSSCDQVACHGAGLPEPPAVVPRWNDATSAAKACGACHGAPPTQHTTSTSCDRSTCHGAEVSRDAHGVLGITDAGKALHIDGVLELPE